MIPVDAGGERMFATVVVDADRTAGEASIFHGRRPVVNDDLDVAFFGTAVVHTAVALEVDRQRGPFLGGTKAQ